MPQKEIKENPVRENRILLCYFIIVLLLGGVAAAVVVRVFRTGVVEKEKWEKVAQSQQRPDRLVLPARGNIYSVDGKLMATSVPRYNTYIDFRADGFALDTFLYSKTQSVDALALQLSRKLKNRTPAGYKAYLLRGLAGRSRQYPVYEKRVSYADLKEMRQFPFLRLNRFKSGFYTRETVQRQKPFGMLASRTIGDVYGEIQTGGRTRGRSGLELRYDSLLRGEAGLSSVRRVGGGWTNVVEVEPIDGMDIRTTIDVNIQDITEKALLDMLKKTDAEAGTAVVMEVSTGEIKAITNMGRLRKGIYAETKNYAVADETEPGSTFKVATLMVALEDGVCTPDDMVDTGNGIYEYRGRKITDHNSDKGGNGRISVEKAMWESSNIGIAKVILKGYADNPKRFVEGLYRTGINADLNLEIPGSGRARIRMPDDKISRWSGTTLAWMSFGYEVQIPPIQTLAFFNAIANNGKMLRPIFTKQIVKNGEVVASFSTEVVKYSICSEATLHTMQGILAGAVEKGIGRPAHSDYVSIAGKTGTAQIATHGSYRGGGHQVSFCGYFPVEDPRFSCIVVVRRPRYGTISGGGTSGVVFRNIAEKVYAGHTAFDVRKIDSEEGLAILPAVKGGDAKAVKKVLADLDIDIRMEHSQAQWVTANPDRKENEIDLRETSLKKGLVPRVIGMGAKDAVYLMESVGLQVNLSGRGQVVSQSVLPGQRIVKGETVVLRLR